MTRDVSLSYNSTFHSGYRGVSASPASHEVLDRGGSVHPYSNRTARIAHQKINRKEDTGSPPIIILFPALHFVSTALTPAALLPILHSPTLHLHSSSGQSRREGGQKSGSVIEEHQRQWRWWKSWPATAQSRRQWGFLYLLLQLELGEGVAVARFDRVKQHPRICMDYACSYAPWDLNDVARPCAITVPLGATSDQNQAGFDVLPWLVGLYGGRHWLLPLVAFLELDSVDSILYDGCTSVPVAFQWQAYITKRASPI
ncbi:hypothetical protein BJV74DRAFT_989738 [Russula compacta]|nr:hypothetical protein BJV74DRAFT_989738 [Russula compacta]